MSAATHATPSLPAVPAVLIDQPITVTLALDGTNAGVVVTPASNKAGTFNPTTLTLNTAAESQTTQFTPTATGDHTISVTNGGGLTDGTPVHLYVLDGEPASGGVCADPTFSPSGVASPYTFKQGTDVTVTIACVTHGAKIFFTDNGTVPDARTSRLYTAPITVSRNSKIRAVASASGVASKVVTSRYEQTAA